MDKYFSKPILVALFWVAAVAALFFPLLYGRVLLPTDSDLNVYYYPVFDFFAKALQSGQSFLWMPHIFTGFPVYLSQVGGFLDPVNILLGKLFLTPGLVELRVILDVILVYLFSYLLGKALGLSNFASALIGPSYIIGIDWLYLSNPLIANSLFLLPLLLWVTVRTTNVSSVREKIKYSVLGGIGLGWAVLSGYTQVVFYALVLTGMYVILYSILNRVGVKRSLELCGWFGLLCAIGFILGLPQILPALKFLHLTSRADVANYTQATLKSISPGDFLLFFLPPNFYFPYVTSGRFPLYVGPVWAGLG
ncbi:MAG TPA: hypothetical protein VEA59_06960, partial [Patescibacteria group bacterium]|nr:hypothetical protein [Patescibacteria group bacterium]